MKIALYNYCKPVEYTLPVDVCLDDEVIYSPEGKEYIVCLTVSVSNTTAKFLNKIVRLVEQAGATVAVIERVLLDDGLSMYNVTVDCIKRGSEYYIEFTSMEQDVVRELVHVY